ncbi:uncharacterized protein KY384_004831 [Bacidia gigantensis]|uniref:uncharacterized protein n=1 Tax=Bacidia gigantensis TaxID=2732470 RepID=UPI001D051823|nr:uncharacterized protein KY384_004831 [Bacidia gigantensis]KAG8530329.1 hypothetical protein KY384_004831 [Bacidia gigantensis]
MSPARTILITGANRGIGFSILQALATRSPSDCYLLGCRKAEDGEAAISQFRNLGITAEIHVVVLDVSNESSIKAAEQIIRTTYQNLDVMINNAGIALLEAPDHSNIPEIYAATFQTNVTGVALMMSTFLPLLKATSTDPRIINVSSARGSLYLASSGKLPPSTTRSYCVSKAALNMLTVEYARAEPEVKICAAEPGSCKTAFNGFRGQKDPLDGAKVVVELALADKRKYVGGFWGMNTEDKEAQEVPW